MKKPSYKFYEFEHEREDGSICTRIAAVSSFMNKRVRGYADCHPLDEFDLEFGKGLAGARCNLKIAEKRCKRAYSKVDEAKRALEAAQVHLDKMLSYEADAERAYNIAAFEVAQWLDAKGIHEDVETIVE